ncbi:MAG: hypothetical protein HYY06_09160 [Deltaproteobacteria bacterium]|nr:hypothetical protein [Deltaproteobacteria bacterium]
MLKAFACFGALLAAPAGVAFADEEAIVVEAGEPVPVPVDAVVERLRTELPGVTVSAASTAVPGAPSPAGTGGTVTIALSPEGGGRLLVSYRDAGGRETTRIVADTGDPHAMAAAIAMIIANLHQSQVDSVLAMLPRAAPASEPPPPPPPVVQARVVRRRPSRVSRPAPGRGEDGWLSLGWAPFVSLIADSWPVLGLNVGADATFGAWRFEAALGYSPGMSLNGEYTWAGDVRWSEVGYTQTVGSLFARRMLLDGESTKLGLGAGLGFLIEAYSYEYVEPEPPGGAPDGSSYLEAVFSASTSIDVRVIWRELWWSSRVDLAVSTAPDDGSWYRPVAAQMWLQIATGVRVTL